MFEVEAVIAAPMPSGVEHPSLRPPSSQPEKVIAAPMPSGVEHTANPEQKALDFGRDRRADAFGR